MYIITDSSSISRWFKPLVVLLIVTMLASGCKTMSMGGGSSGGGSSGGGSSGGGSSGGGSSGGGSSGGGSSGGGSSGGGSSGGGSSGGGSSGGGSSGGGSSGGGSSGGGSSGEIGMPGEFPGDMNGGSAGGIPRLEIPGVGGTGSDDDCGDVNFPGGTDQNDECKGEGESAAGKSATADEIGGSADEVRQVRSATLADILVKPMRSVPSVSGKNWINP